MAQPPGLCLLLLLGLGAGGSPACYDPRGRPRRCMPVFENAAFGRAVHATNTCGSPPEDYCLQMGARHASTLCHRCDASHPQLHHNASFLTDFHSQEESTWWQSQSMAFGIQHPNSVNITLHLGKCHQDPPRCREGIWGWLHQELGAEARGRCFCIPWCLVMVWGTKTELCPGL